LIPLGLHVLSADHIHGKQAYKKTRREIEGGMYAVEMVLTLSPLILRREMILTKLSSD
jgi:hypothetical protein